MTNRADLILAIQANTDALKAVQADLAGIGRGGQAAATQTTGALNRIKETAAGMGLERIGEAGVRGLTALVTGAFGAGEGLEQLRVRYTNLLGSTAAANAEIARLTQIANNSAFNLPGLAAGEARLIATGKSADEARRLLLAVGNTAAGIGANQEGTDRIVVALQQMIDKGKVSAQELNQLSENGVPALSILAQAIGRTNGETQKLVETGTVAADTFVQAFEANAATRFGNAMASNANTMQGLISTAQDLVGTLGGNAMAAGFQELEPVLSHVLTELQDPQTVANVTALGKALGDAAASGLTLAENLGQTLGLLQKTTPEQDALTKAQGALQAVLAAGGQQQIQLSKNSQQQVHDVNRQLDETRAAYDQILNPLREKLRLENESYQQAVTARDLARAQTRVGEDTALAGDLFSSAGQAARDRLPGERDRVGDLQFQQAHQGRVDAIQDEIAKQERLRDAQLATLEKQKRAAQDATSATVNQGTQIVALTKHISDQVLHVQALAQAWAAVAAAQAALQIVNQGTDAAATDASNMGQLGTPAATARAAAQTPIGAAAMNAAAKMTQAVIADLLHPGSVGSKAAHEAAMAAQAQLGQAAGNALGTAFAGPNNKAADQIWMGGKGSPGMYHYPILGVDFDALMGRPYNVPALNPMATDRMKYATNWGPATGNYTVKVYVGNTELKDIVKTEISQNGQIVSQSAAQYQRGRQRGGAQWNP